MVCSMVIRATTTHAMNVLPSNNVCIAFPYNVYQLVLGTRIEQTRAAARKVCERASAPCEEAGGERGRYGER